MGSRKEKTKRKQSQTGKRDLVTQQTGGKRSGGGAFVVAIALVIVLAIVGIYSQQKGETSGAALKDSSTKNDATPSALSDAKALATDPSKPSNASGSTGGKPNVLLITVDSLRADHVGCYGGNTLDTLAIDALALEGVRFAHAMTVVPITAPSHATILTGKYPANHGMRDNGPYALADSHTTVAELFKAAGYATSAFVSSFFLDSRNGFSQGFTTFDQSLTMRRPYVGLIDPLPQRPGEQTVSAAIRWLQDHLKDNPQRSFFTWVNLFDAQFPYVAPEPFASKYKERTYLAEVAYVDKQIGQLTEFLRSHGLWDNTIVVLVGSHGEGLREHGEETHGLLLYDSTVAVPMIWHTPVWAGSPRVETEALAATIDVAPTLLALVGIPSPTPFDGLDLFGQNTNPIRTVYVESLSPKL
ncbi:MAG: sulfatase, partial [Planctomycetota bacterium]